MWFTSSMNMSVHFEEKALKSKAAIGVNWKKMYSNKNVNVGDKFKLFHATASSILLYGAQCWGYERFEQVEEVLRFFLKRLFRLPVTSPNYCFKLEFNIGELFLTTFKLHMKYIRKIRLLENSRVPKKIATFLISNNLQFYRMWTMNAARFGLQAPNFTEFNSFYKSVSNKLFM